MCASRPGIPLLARCSVTSALEESTADLGAGSWFDRTAKQDVRDRAAASAEATDSDSSGPCYSSLEMSDDLCSVINRTWYDLWQENSTLTHAENADWVESFSPTYSITPSSNYCFLPKLCPDQVLTRLIEPEIVRSQSRDNNYDGCTSSGPAKEFSCESYSSVIGGKTTMEFGNSSKMLDSFSVDESCSFSNSGLMEYYSKSRDNQDDSFLDYDWASMTDFDDLDGILSNYSAPGDTSTEKTGEILSAMDSKCSKMSSHLLPEHRTCVMTGESCSHSLQEECQGKLGAENGKHSRFWLMEDKRNMDRGHHPSQWSSYDYWMGDTDNEMDCHLASALSQQDQVGDSKFVQNLLSYQQNPGQDDYAAPFLSPFHVAKKQRRHVPDGYFADYHCTLENVSSMPRSGKMLSTKPTMTPLQKIGKLRCNQQMQATHAISQQQKQFDLQFPAADLEIPPTPLQIIPDGESSGSNWSRISSEGIARNDQLSEIKIPVTNEVDDISRAESALCELQNVISKLDDNSITCIRDSLFRLARSATERCNGCDSCTTACSWADDKIMHAVGMLMKYYECSK